jgi:hypothetical protein
MGQIWEQCMGKLNCLAGNIGHFAVPFTPTGEGASLTRMGREQMYSVLCMMMS